MKPSKVRGKLIQEVEEALETLRSHEEEAVRFHGARKKIKAIRAHLRLLRTELGEDRYEFENQFLRDTGRLLSSRRDALVIGQTCDALVEQTPGLREPDLTKIREAVAAYQHRLVGKLAASRLSDEAARRLQTAVHRWQNLDSAIHDKKAVKKGLKKTYRAGEKRREVTMREPRPENFHEWRKAVKYLRHQVELLEENRGKARLAARLKKLGDLLGEDHDYFVVEAILKSPSLRANPGARKLRRKIASLQSNLREQSLELGETLYRRPAEKFYEAVVD